MRAPCTWDGYDTAAATTAARWARTAGIPVIADLDELYPGVEKLIENIDYLHRSRDFPCRLMAEGNLEQALAPDATPLWVPAHRCNLGTRRRAGVGWKPFSSQLRLPRPRGRHNRCRRHLPRRIHLWLAARVAPGKAA